MRTGFRLIARRKSLGLIYLANVLVALHYYLVLYINSSFLESFVGKEKLGLLYALGAALSIGLFLSAGRILNRLGGFRALVLFIALEMLAIGGLAFSTSALSAAFFFILHLGTAVLIPYTLDVFLEFNIKDESLTGRLRTIYLTLGNVMLVAAPAIVGLILGESDSFEKVYFTSLAVLAVLLIFSSVFRKYKEIRPAKIRLKDQWEKMPTDIRRIISVQLVLQFFYATMVVYTPLYLYTEVGFSWATIGTIFTVMLLPFILFEIPVGELADKKMGEKEILITGIVIMALSAATIAFVESVNPVFWASLLFMSRVGASFTESASESYFFKHVGGDDSSLISFYRLTSPSAYIVAPLVGSLALFFLPFQYVFLVLGIIVFLGLKFALVIKDTR